MSSARVMHSKDVADALDISQSHAYKIIRRLNRELEELGCLTVSGRVSRDYFEERFFNGGDHDGCV